MVRSPRSLAPPLLHKLWDSTGKVQRAPATATGRESESDRSALILRRSIEHSGAETFTNAQQKGGSASHRYTLVGARCPPGCIGIDLADRASLQSRRLTPHCRLLTNRQSLATVRPPPPESLPYHLLVLLGAHVICLNNPTNTKHQTTPDSRGVSNCSEPGERRAILKLVPSGRACHRSTIPIPEGT
eukprot:scaffold47543_cov32-Tisochrysis_lutea.AAC.2